LADELEYAEEGVERCFGEFSVDQVKILGE
jgi:hypothetical protein